MTYRSSANGEKPGSYQLATRAGKTTINPGEVLFFEQYVTGYGEVTSAKVQAYISTDAFELTDSHILSSLVAKSDDEERLQLSWGNQKDILTDTGFTFLMAGLQKGPNDESTMIFDDGTGHNILLCERKLGHAPFEYTLKTRKNLSPGEHYIDFYLCYFNGEKWIISKERVPFKVRNIFERYAKLISALALIASLSGIAKFTIIPITQFLLQLILDIS